MISAIEGIATHLSISMQNSINHVINNLPSKTKIPCKLCLIHYRQYKRNFGNHYSNYKHVFDALYWLKTNNPFYEYIETDRTSDLINVVVYTRQNISTQSDED